MKISKSLAIIGCGNIGSAIAKGLLDSKIIKPSNITLTKRKIKPLEKFKEYGVKITSDNVEAVRSSAIVIIAVTPQKADAALEEISGALDEKRQMLLSVVTGVEIKHIKKIVGEKIPVVRLMPNTAISIKESMTCISADKKDSEALETAVKIFNTVGKTAVISEDLIEPATALVACGVAFFLRAIRAAGQGGTEIGFHAEDAIMMAAQTAKGAASLLVDGQMHPEREIDKVTTPQGLTISGLNQMEHNGFSSAMIKGIVTAAEKAASIHKK
ncbi:MAG: pyrroline-5-carboxylate reductase [Chlorobi bacterium]|nr:pyrroline-5-carboxylate reductase [Chlorobiota bacterium]